MNIREALKRVNQLLQKKIDDALTHEVFAEVREEEIAAIEDVVLNPYDPVIYQRRGYGGIDDPENIEILGGRAAGGVLQVVNTTPANPGGCLENGHVTTGKNLSELIEFGDGYKGYIYDFRPKGRTGQYMRPRPFTKKTIERLKVKSNHIYALREGLRKRGVGVK